MRNNKTLLVIPYFGKLPHYLKLFFKGCENNKWLDVLIITDDVTPKDYPKTISFKQDSLLGLSNRISEIHGLKNYFLPNAYKLCDWRPSYGLIFNDEIKEYNYWAYGDLDVIYGDMHSYVMSKYEENIDFISFRHEYLSGSLTIIKNNVHNNNLFTGIKNYLQEIQMPAYQAFDEVKYRWNAMRSSLNANLSFSEVVYQSYLKNEIKISFENVICEEIFPKQCVFFKQTELTLDENEIKYFHFVCNKSKYYFHFPEWKQVPSEFYIYETGFYKKRKFERFQLLAKAYYSMPYYGRKILRKILKELNLKIMS